MIYRQTDRFVLVREYSVVDVTLTSVSDSRRTDVRTDVVSSLSRFGTFLNRFTVLNRFKINNNALFLLCVLDFYFIFALAMSRSKFLFIYFCLQSNVIYYIIITVDKRIFISRVIAHMV